IAGSASASSWRGHATRTMSQPAAVSSAICCRVALMSWVGVVVIDCTVIGASPPTWMSPSLTLRVFRRGASTGGGCLTDGIPRLTEVTPPLWTRGPGVARRGGTPPPLLHDPGGTRHARSGEQGDGLDDVRIHQQQGHRDEHERHRIGQRQHPRHVHRSDRTGYRGSQTSPLHYGRADQAWRGEVGHLHRSCRTPVARATPAQGNRVMGSTMSAYTSSRVIAMNTSATALVSGSIRDMSTGPGSGLPRSRVRNRRTPSYSAPATCPPSSGSSGSRLNTNSAMFSEASIESIVPIFSRSSKPGWSAAATSPARRETPTTPSGPFGSRSAPPKAACPTSHRRTGRVSTGVPVRLKADQASSGTAAGD